MNAYIFFSWNYGIGSTYDSLYRILILQKQLKNLGYNVFVHANFGSNPYKINSNNRDVFSRLLKIDLIDNLILHTDKHIEWHHEGDAPHQPSNT